MGNPVLHPAYMYGEGELEEMKPQPAKDSEKPQEFWMPKDHSRGPAERHRLGILSGQAIIAIDPGNTTGVAICGLSDLPFLRTRQYQTVPNFGAKASHFLYDMLFLAQAGRYKLKKDKIPRDRHVNQFICEDFILSNEHLGGHTRNSGLSPVAVTAGLQQFFMAFGLYRPDRWRFQTASLAKSAFDDERLELVLPFAFRDTKGRPHARDALRHLATHLKQHQPVLWKSVRYAQDRLVAEQARAKAQTRS